MSDVADKLREARAILEKRGAWTRDAWARDADGHSCDPADPDAVCFCVMGALARASRIGFSELEYTPQFETLKNAVGIWPAYFNDKPTTRKRDVLAALDKAIELAGEPA